MKELMKLSKKELRLKIYELRDQKKRIVMTTNNEREQIRIFREQARKIKRSVVRVVESLNYILEHPYAINTTLGLGGRKSAKHKR